MIFRCITILSSYMEKFRHLPNAILLTCDLYLRIKFNIFKHAAGFYERDLASNGMLLYYISIKSEAGILHWFACFLGRRGGNNNNYHRACMTKFWTLLLSKKTIVIWNFFLQSTKNVLNLPGRSNKL